VLTASSTNITAFWNIAACSLVEVGRYLRRPYCLHHQCDEQAAHEGFAFSFPSDIPNRLFYLELILGEFATKFITLIASDIICIVYSVAN
jgi:hypothetical protein